MQNSRFAIRKLHRAGDSIQVTIPREICRALDWDLDTRVYVYLVGRVVCVKRFDEGGFQPEVVAVRAAPVGERIG